MKGHRCMMGSVGSSVFVRLLLERESQEMKASVASSRSASRAGEDQRYKATKTS